VAERGRSRVEQSRISMHFHSSIFVFDLQRSRSSLLVAGRVEDQCVTHSTQLIHT